MAGMSALIAACGIVAQADLLAAIVLVESSGNRLALAVNGAMELARVPRDRAEAAAMARWLKAHRYSFDAGLAQVNSANLARLGLDEATVFEPCPNLRAAAAILDECRERAWKRGLPGGRAVAAAISCYNTGHLTRGVRNGYVAAVRAALARAHSREPGRRRRSAGFSSASFPSAWRRPEAFELASAEALPPPQGLERAPRPTASVPSAPPNTERTDQ
jgi:type IV secretion system protein VirB1